MDDLEDPDGPSRRRHRDDGHRSHFFGRLPKDLSSFIRSRSLTNRRVSVHADVDHRRRSRSKLTLAEVEQDMLDDIANGRTSRSAKGDPALFNLISHSRSRSPSRSKGDKEAVEVSAVDVPELRAEQPSPQSPHKPASLLLSRPLSAATAGTASTVTPNNATPRKRAPAPIPIATVQEEIPAAPKQQLAVKKNFQFFGITLPSPRKSSFSSRSNTPLPPEAATPSVRAPSPPSRASPSPIPKPKPKIKIKPNLVGEGPAPTSRMDNFSKFFVGTGMRVSSDPQPPPPPAATPSKATVSPSKIPTMKHTSKSTTVPQAHVSASTIVAVPSAKPKLAPGPRKTMSEVGNTARTRDSAAPIPTPRVPSSSRSSVGGSNAHARTSAASAIGSPSTARVRTSSISNPRASTGGSALPVPRASTSTIQPRVMSSQSGVGTINSRVSTATVHSRTRTLSTESGSNAYRAYRTRLGGIEEDRRKSKGDDEEPPSPNIPTSGRPAANGRYRGNVIAKSSATVTVGIPTQATATSATASSSSNGIQPMPTTAVHTKSTIGSLGGRKHGSFDFERPGWTAGGRGVGAASSLGVSSRTRRGASGVGTVEGRLGVGSMRQFSLATSGGGNRTVHVVPPPPPTPPQEELRQDHTGASGSSNATGGTSSWGRSTGKRLSTGLSKLTGGLLGSKASKSTVRAGKERQHGKFPFEPPVQSLPPKSTRREHSLESERERDRQWAREDREMGASSPSAPRIRHNASHSTSSTASSNNTGVSAGHRSGTKGRSLDLGLGLAWAPTKVRVDAVMPESSFGRSLSASRREQQGKEVADVFRDALDEDGYRNFKKYVHRFDAQEIPFDGPTGIVSRVERLLRKTQHLQDEERTRLLDRFVKLILQNA